jgi:hypothetical protein
MLLLKYRITWSASLIHCSVVLWRARNPNWLAFSKFRSPICFWIICKMTFSKTLPVEGKRLIGRRFCGILGSLPGFGRATTLASFQGIGKCVSQIQRFIKWVRWTNGLLGRSLRHSFGIPSIPQAFLTFKEFNNFRMSHGLILWGVSLPSASSRAWTRASTRRSWFSSHRSCGVNWFSKHWTLVYVETG